MAASGLLAGFLVPVTSAVTFDAGARAGLTGEDHDFRLTSGFTVLFG